MLNTERTILIIDDCPEDRATYRRYLLQAPDCAYTVLEEESGEAGLERCRHCWLDGILLDFLLPDLDGLEFLAELQSQGKPCPAVIMLTGQGNEAVAVQAMKGGAQDYLVKGRTTPEALRFALHAAIENCQLKQKLRRSEERFSRSVETMLDCFGIFTSIRDASGQIQDFRIDYLNDAACENNRMPRAEQVGRRLCELLPAHRPTGLFQDYCRVVQTGTPLIKEAVVYADVYDSEPLSRCFEILASKLGDGFVATWRDISDRKRMEQTLRQREAYCRSVVEAIPQLVWICDPNGQTLDYNQKWYAYTGQTLEAAQGSGWMDVLHPDDRQPTRDRWQQSVTTGEKYEIEYRLWWAADGTYRWHLAQAEPIRDEQGKILQWFGTCTDIHERKQLQVALEAAHTQISSILQSITDGFVHLDSDWRYTYVNDQATLLLGKPATQLLGRVIWDTFPELLGTQMESVSRQAVAEQQTRQYEEFYPSLQKWLAVRLYPSAQGLGIYFLDISDRKRAEAEATRLLAQEQAARAEAETANRSKDDFIAMVSHDLRAPLNAILGWAQLLRHPQRQGNMLQQGLDIIERSARTQAQLLEDLLDLSRIVQGQLVLHPVPVQLVALVEESLQAIYPLARHKGIELESILAVEIEPFAADPHRLKQVLANLLGNAIKFTPAGGRVSLSVQRFPLDGSGTAAQLLPYACAQIEIRDTGEGIDPELLPHIFERFYQAQGQHRGQGLGLGLAIARHLVELHGGSLWAESPGKGQGATFTILLPLVTTSIA